MSVQNHPAARASLTIPGMILLGSLLVSCGSASTDDLSATSAPEKSAAIAPGASSSEISFREDGRLTISRDAEVYAELAIEIADNDSSRTRGMMQRISMPEHSGMIFLFDREEDRSFWMANTPLSLDLIFIDSDSTITMIKRYMQPLSAMSVPSEGPSQYVLEVIAGYSDTIGIIEGDRLSWYRYPER